MLLCFLKYLRNSPEILDGRDHDLRFNDDFSDLIASSRDFLKFSFSQGREARQSQFGIICNRQES